MMQQVKTDGGFLMIHWVPLFLFPSLSLVLLLFSPSSLSICVTSFTPESLCLIVSQPPGGDGVTVLLATCYPGEM